MTTAAQDISNYAGVPIVLYDFFRKSVPTLTGVLVETHWRYTSADRDVVHAGDVYAATAIVDNGIRQVGSTVSDQLTITMPYLETVPQMFKGSAPSDPINCIIRHTNEDETDAFVAWAGVVGSVGRGADTGSLGSATATLSCNTVSATMDRSGLRLSWSRGCPHDLYGFECRADPRNFYVSATVSALSGNTITASTIAGVSAGQLMGGFLEWIDADGHAERYGIVEQQGPTIAVMGTTEKLTVGNTVYVFFGCDHSRSTCELVFGNEKNHGGHAYMPDENPFSGTLVF